MNDAHLHLVLNHLPIITPILGLLVMIAGFIFRSEVIKRTAFGLFFLGAILTLPAFITGEGAEEVIENLSGVEEKFIEIHEETAETFEFLSYGLGLLSLVGLWASWKNKSFSKILTILVLVFAFVVLYFGKETGTTGGEIRHPEIRESFIPTPGE
jgi:uncharacterized membrane protein